MRYKTTKLSQTETQMSKYCHSTIKPPQSPAAEVKLTSTDTTVEKKNAGFNLKELNTCFPLTLSSGGAPTSLNY